MRTLKMKLTHIILIAISFILIPEKLHATEQSSLEITPNSSLTIILGKSPTSTAKIAADDLMRCLEKSLGCKVKITDSQDNLSEQDICVFIGPSEATLDLPLDNLRPDYFVTQVRNRKIFLAGKDDQGDPLADYFVTRTPTMYATYNFLHRFLGIRWLWPGKSGEIIPIHTSISIPCLNEINGPKLPLRYSYYNNGRFYSKKSKDNMILWGRRNGLGASMKGSVGHNSSKVLGNKYYDEHPEYYAIVRGKRLALTKYGKLCDSNLALPKLFADYGEHEDCDYFSASPNDGRGWCECNDCRKLDGANPITPEGTPNVSGRIFSFVNRVAGELKLRNSKKMVAIYAYCDYVNPPHNIEKLEDNVLLFVARGINWNYAPTMEAEFKDIVSKWSRKCSKIVLRDYKDNLRPMQVAPYPKLVDQYIKYLATAIENFQGINFCGDDSRDYSLLGPTMYVYAKLLWNPQARLDDILEEYYSTGWPNAGCYVREYFEFFENRTAETSRKYDTMLYSYQGGNALRIIPIIYSQEAFHKGETLLELAYSSAQSKEEKDRVDFLRIGFKAVQNDMDYYNALIALAKSGEPFPRIPIDSIKPVSFEEKKKLVNQAFMAMEKRQAFLIKHKDSEAIPSAPLGNAYPECNYLTRGWDYLIKKLKTEIGSNANPNIITDPWKFSIDPNEKGIQEGWFKPEHDDSRWDNITTSTFWEHQGYGTPKYSGGYNGWAWYRKRVQFLQKSSSDNLALVLGAVDESYDIYMNGNLIKQFRYDADKDPDSWRKPHEIFLGEHIRWGKDNLLAIAVLDKAGMGGIWQPCYFKVIPQNLITQDVSKWIKTEGVDIVTNNDKPQITEVTVHDDTNLPADIHISIKNIKGGKNYALSLSVCPLKTSANQKLSSIKHPTWFNSRIIFKEENGKTLEPHIWPTNGYSLKKDAWTAVSRNFKVPESAQQLEFTIFFPYAGIYRFRDINLFLLEEKNVLQ